jgi:predicted adenine nucleotide alpha hydrolase (AANH) superfamily ATPase
MPIESEESMLDREVSIFEYEAEYNMPRERAIRELASPKKTSKPCLPCFGMMICAVLMLERSEEYAHRFSTTTTVSKLRLELESIFSL